MEHELIAPYGFCLASVHCCAISWPQPVNAIIPSWASKSIGWPTQHAPLSEHRPALLPLLFSHDWLLLLPVVPLVQSAHALCISLRMKRVQSMHHYTARHSWTLHRCTSESF